MVSSLKKLELVPEQPQNVPEEDFLFAAIADLAVVAADQWNGRTVDAAHFLN